MRRSKSPPPPLIFPNVCVLSWRWMESPCGTMAQSGTKGSSKVSMKTITLQFLMSCWNAIRLRSSSSLLSSDWTFPWRILGRGGRFSRFLSLNRTPARDPRFLRLLHWPGEAAGRQGRSPLFAGHGEKVFFTDVLMRRSCSLSYSMKGLTLVIHLLLKVRHKIKK